MAARMTPAARRARIVEAARAVVERQGLAATTVRDIAAEMGTSAGLVHHYIDSMDGLLAEVFETVAREGIDVTRGALAAADGPLAQLDAFLDTALRPGHGSRFQLWLDAWAEAARRPELGATSRRLNIEWQRLLADVIEGGVAAGDFDCADPDATSWRILSLLDGLVLQLVAHHITLDGDQVRTWVARFAEHELALAAGVLDLVDRPAPPDPQSLHVLSPPSSDHHDRADREVAS